MSGVPVDAGRGCSPEHRAHISTPPLAPRDTFPPCPSEWTGELGALQPPDPDETPRARQPASPGVPAHPEAGGKDAPKPVEHWLHPSTTHCAGSQIGKTLGVAHAGPGVLPARAVRWPQGQRAPTCPCWRPSPSSSSGGKMVPGQVWGSPDAAAGTTKASCHGDTHCHPSGSSGPGWPGEGMAGLEQGSGGGWDRGRLRRADLGDLGGTGVGSTEAPGCPPTEAGVGEGEENEAQRGLSSCRFNVGKLRHRDGRQHNWQGNTASHPLPPPAPHSRDAMGLGTPPGTRSGPGVAPLRAQPGSAPSSRTGSPSRAAAFPLPG